MSALVDRVQAALKEFPMVVGGTKLTKEAAESKIWFLLADNRIGVAKDDPETHSLLSSDLISEKDFRTVFCDEGKFALPSVRGLMKHLLAKTEVSETPETPVGGKVLEAIVSTLNANKPIGQYKTKELLEDYGADSSEEVWTELEKRAKKLPCIVFEKDGTVNVDVSLEVLQAIRKGQTFTSVYSDGKKTYRLYTVGCFPEEAVLCCPITNKILNNGYCSELGISWKDVDEECMTFVRVIRDQNPCEKFGKFAAKSLLKLAKEGMEALREDYPEEAIVYDEMKELKQLPSLRVNLSSLAEGRKFDRKLADPFGSP